MKRIVIIAVLAVVAIVGAAVVFHAASSSDSSSRKAAIGSGTPTAGDAQFTMTNMSGSPLLSGAAIKVQEWSWGAESPTAVASGTGGATAGKAAFERFTVSKNIDNASNLLYSNLTRGIPVNLTLKDGVLTYVFAQAYVTKIEQSGVGADANEHVEFVYVSAKTTNGVPGSNPPAYCWDVTKNLAC